MLFQPKMKGLPPNSELRLRLCKQSFAAISLAVFAAVFTFAFAGYAQRPTPVFDSDMDFKAPQRNIGERLTLDTRFSKFFAVNSAGDANHTLSVGDSVVAKVATPQGLTEGPFSGKSVNCRSCHYVDELAGTGGARNRTYADYAPRSPKPATGTRTSVTARNSIAFVNAFIDKKNGLFHADGEFSDLETLIEETWTGPNFGWALDEHDKAVAHIAHVIRDDDGENELDRRYGGSYRKVLRGNDNSLRAGLRLPAEFQIDVTRASDREIFDALLKIMDAYLSSLEFSRSFDGHYDGSPYDAFLRLNELPLGPERGESDADYTVRLRHAVEALESPQFIAAGKFKFNFHSQPFVFGPTEFEGLKIFLRKPVNSGTASRHGIGNCATCHTPPNFTDAKFHNTGVTQEEYDSVHGQGAFMRLKIPGYTERIRNADYYLPATRQHPNASEAMRSPADKRRPQLTDLGVWNIFGNPDYPEPQAKLAKMFCSTIDGCEYAKLLPATIARFRTPSVRDLADSDPYMHNGSKQSVDDVLRFYIRVSEQSRAGKIRNSDKKLSNIRITSKDTAALKAFLASLTEDYEAQIPSWKR